MFRLSTIISFLFFALLGHSQKTLEFRILRVYSTIGDMDTGPLSDLDGVNSDPRWDFSIQDLTNGITQNGFYSLPETNCPNTRIISQVFFSQPYCTQLPSAYLFTWSAIEEDLLGGDAPTGNEIIPLAATDINIYQSSWTALANRTLYVNGTTCSGGQVAWGLYLQYRVIGSFSTINADFALNPSTGCSLPHTVTFTDQSTSPDTWSWEFGDGSTSTLQNPVHNYTSNGTFVVRLAVENSISGCVDTTYDTVSVSNPAADFVANNLFGCGPLSTSFTDQSGSSVPITAWNWNFGDGNISTVQNPTHIYQTPGIYTITLFVTDSNGCTVSSARTNYIQVIGPDVNFGFDDSIACSNQTINFTDSTTFGAPITSWTWDFGDGSPTSPLQNPSHIYTSPGTFIISLTVTDIDGCSRTKIDSITSISISANYTAIDSITCSPASVSFTDLSNATNGIDTWRWKFGDGGTSNIQNPSHFYTNYTDSATLIVTDTNSGCIDSIKKSIQVYEITNSYSINNTPNGNANICINDSVPYSSLIHPTIMPIQSYYWDFGDGNTSTNQTGKHKYAVGGYYNCYYVETDSLGCTDTSFFNITVQQPIAYFKVDQQTGCDSLLVSFTDSSYFLNLSPGITSAINVYSYDFGDGGTSALQNPTHNYTTPGVYQSSLSTGNNGSIGPLCMDTSYVTITIFESTDTIFHDTICENQLAISVLGNTLPSVTGSYFDTIINTNGCDSIIQTNLFVNPITNDTIYDTICSSDSIQLPSGNYTSTAGTYTDTLQQTSTTCDSIITVILTVNDTSHVTIYDTICSTDSIQLFNGLFTNIAGVYSDTLQKTATGCDSILTLNLFVNDTSNITIYDTICENDSLQLPSGAFVNTAGIYMDTLTKVITGCDSIISTHVYINDTSHTSIYDTICANETYLLPSGSGSANITGIYMDTLARLTTGCDSILTIYLHVNDTSLFTIFDTICFNQAYSLPGGGSANTSGVYTDTLQKSTTGCDSIIETNLYVVPPGIMVIDTGICEGDSILIQSTYHSQNGTYYDSLTTSSGCDSLIQINLTINQNKWETLNQKICSGDSVFLAGQWRTNNGTFIDSLLTTKGCDSIVTTNLTVSAPTQNKVYDTICSGQSIFVGGANQTVAGNYFDSLTTSAGCDSIVETELYVNTTPTFSHSNDTLITLGDQVPLFVTSGYTYNWTPVTGLSCTNCSSPTATPLTTITYQVTVRSGPCDSNVSITINVQEETEIFVPTIFSPNGDNWNDLFKVRGSVFTNFNMIIFDRWGEKVFVTDSYIEGWDGKFRGKDCNKGVYAYMIEGLDHKNRVFKKKGNITLVR